MNAYLNVFGLPAHPLVVHATVVMVPLAALLVVAAGCSRRVRHRAGYLTPLIALVALVLVPLSTHTGEQLKARLPGNALIDTHARLADGLLPWVLGLLIAAVLITVVRRRERSAADQPADHHTGPVTAAGDVLVGTRTAPAVRTPPVALRATAVVLAALTATGTLVEVYRIGDSGARAAWHMVPRTPLPGSDGG